MPPLAAYTQSSTYTCGEACLVVALHELTGAAMSRERELELWRKLLPCRWRPVAFFFEQFFGTPPVRLVRFLQKTAPTLNCTLHLHPHPYECIGRYRWIFRAACIVHDRLWLPWKRLRPRAFRYRRAQSPADVTNLLSEHPRAYIIQVVIIHEGMLHFILIRHTSDDDLIAVMNPSEGENRCYDIGEFETAFTDQLFGYMVTLHPKAPALEPTQEEALPGSC